MDIKSKNIAIVGGGPGGLTLARLLQMNGANVKVYERDLNREVRVQGATLDLHDDSGLKALRAAGLMEEFKASYRPGADKLRIVDKHGVIRHAEDVNAVDEFFRPEIDRGPLREILLNSLKSDTVIWNSQFVSLQQIGDKVRMEFKNGTFVEADIVVAADGANSKIRPYITDIKPFYSGVTVVEGAVYNSEKNSPKIHALLNGGKIFGMGDEKTLIISSKGDGSLVFYTGCKTNESWYRDSGINFSDKTEVLNWFKKEFKAWDNVWSEIFENASGAFIPRPQYCMPFDQQWQSLSTITMLGDAAHLMPPYAGEGVNMAMQDALELAEFLLNENYKNSHDAIAAYEKQMLKRASEVAHITMDQTASLHSKDGLKNLIEMFNAHDQEE